MEKTHIHPFTQKLLSTSSVFKEFPVHPMEENYRYSLPRPGKTSDKHMLWTIFKENMGKDLWSVTMPVTFNEPLSFLQRLNEQLEYQELLRNANTCSDRYLKLGLVFAHSYMMFTNTINRINKTFNPLLGETYEFIDKDLHCIMEQVSHHPPICAFHAESNDYILEGNFLMKTELKLTSFKMAPLGETTVKLKSTGETFSLIKPKTRLYNYIVGKLYVWYEGPMSCINLQTNDKLELIFKKKGWSTTGDYMVGGTLTDGKGNLVYNVEGNWKDNISLVGLVKKDEIQLCQRRPEPENSETQFNFTQFAIQSNLLTTEMLSKLPPTDCRLRPDIRAYEFGNVKLAGEEKNRLEESQRMRRKNNLELKKEWKPLWFEFTKDGNQICTRFKGEYWKFRETGNWPHEISDLYNK